MGKSASGDHSDISSSTQSAADRLVAQLRSLESQWSSLPDRAKWADGETLLRRVQASADEVARQIKLSSSNPNHS